MKKIWTYAVAIAALVLLTFGSAPLLRVFADNHTADGVDLAFDTFTFENGVLFVSVENAGTTDFAGQFVLQVQWIDEGGQLLDDNNFIFDGAVAANGTATVVNTIPTVPENSAMMTLVLDAAQQVDETVEENNTVSMALDAALQNGDGSGDGSGDGNGDGDAGNQNNNSGNNGGSGNPGPNVDLEFSTVTFENGRLTVRVTNNGTDAFTGQFVTQFAWIDGTGAEISQVNVLFDGTIPSGETVTVIDQLPEVPANAAMITFLLDAADQVSETVEQNNTTSEVVTPQDGGTGNGNGDDNGNGAGAPGGVADLRVAFTTFVNGRLTVRVTNEGTTDVTDPFVTQVEWLSATGTVLGELNILTDEDIPVGEIVTVIDLIPEIPQGTADVRVTVDAANQIPESNETNNADTMDAPNVLDGGQQPGVVDLEIVTTTFADGRLTVVVHNSGPDDFTGEFVTQIQWLSATNTILGTLNILFDGTIGVSTSVAVVDQIPDVPAGTERVRVIIDAAEQVAERNEINNEGSQAVPPGAQPPDDGDGGGDVPPPAHGSGLPPANGGGGGGGGGNGSGGFPPASFIVVTNQPMTLFPGMGGELTATFADGSRVRLVVPTSAVTVTTTFTIAQTQLTPEQTPTLFNVLFFLVGNRVYRIEAHNTVTNQPITTNFAKNLDIFFTLPALAQATDDVGLYQFSSTTKAWHLLSATSTASTTLAVKVSHLSFFGVFEMAQLRDTLPTAASPDDVLGDRITECPLTPGKTFKTATDPAVWYITSDCTKRPFRSPSIFFTYFTRWDVVAVVTQQKLGEVPTDPRFVAPGPLFDPQYGAIVRAEKSTSVYALLGGQKRLFESVAIFNALGYPASWIEVVSPQLVSRFPTGAVINFTDRHPAFTIIKYTNDPRVYRLEPHPKTGEIVKRHIASETVFISRGFRWDRILTISPSETYPDGIPITR